MLLVKVDHFKVVSKLHLNGFTFLPEYGPAHSREVFSDGNMHTQAWATEGLGSKMSQTLKAQCIGSGGLMEGPYLGSGHKKV